jgi:hypothetical protein
MTTCTPTTAVNISATTTAATHNENVGKSCLGYRQSSAARVSNVFVVLAAISVGSGRGI